MVMKFGIFLIFFMNVEPAHAHHVLSFKELRFIMYVFCIRAIINVGTFTLSATSV